MTRDLWKDLITTFLCKMTVSWTRSAKEKCTYLKNQLSGEYTFWS